MLLWRTTFAKRGRFELLALFCEKLSVPFFIEIVTSGKKGDPYPQVLVIRFLGDPRQIPPLS